MARCGCASQGCGCAIQAGDNITVTGTGVPTLDPYIISAPASGTTFINVSDTATIDLSISGSGTTMGDPYILSAVAIPEGIQDIIGASLGDGLAYDDGLNTISACISADADNVIIFGTDGCLYAPGADPTVFMTLHTAQTATGAKTWDLPDDNTTAIRINTVSGVDPNTSSDTFAIYWSGSVRAGWFNEWGGLRVFTVNPANLGYSDQAIKLFSRQNVQTFQIIRANTSNVGFALEDVGTNLVQQYGGYSDWVALSNFTNGFSAYNLTTYYQPEVRLRVGGDGPEFKGRILTDATPAATQVIATIPAAPAGMRPIRIVQCFVPANDGTLVQLDIEPDGDIVCQTSGTYTSISLDGLSVYGLAD